MPRVVGNNAAAVDRFARKKSFRSLSGAIDELLSRPLGGPRLVALDLARISPSLYPMISTGMSLRCSSNSVPSSAKLSIGGHPLRIGPVAGDQQAGLGDILATPLPPRALVGLVDLVNPPVAVVPVVDIVTELEDDPPARPPRG